MPCQSYAPYRAFKIDVQVTTGKTLCLHSAGRRYKVSWTISPSGQSAQKVIASFPEQLEFMSEQDAFRYAEKRAHTFIDGMLSESPTVSTQ
ncbi:MAG: hypothetical protein QOC89_3850 [Paraburkholderia sp.]|jgi:hypothetical protein|uniref:hypothetical protein n=1 Tax=Paraburkholderia sp. TaxID=1926495 RepID=UPI002AFE6B17|nr:hypothetical protein [Paraburkholderia sp.]MEA3086153.1 hypothetical protein [Paraburkholderia sp.]MEA3128669.1 hypothetical protein [Paraburkholderia sp.]